VIREEMEKRDKEKGLDEEMEKRDKKNRWGKGIRRIETE
jgi:hypothetical protein